MAERRFKDLQAALKNVDTEALRVILAWRNSAHFLRANYLRETFLLGRNFAALRCLELRVIPGQPAVPMQVLVVELLLLRLDAMTTEVTRAGLRLVAGPQAMTTDKMESLCNVLLQCRIYFAGLEQKFPVDGCQQYWRLLERVFVLGEIGLLGKIQEVCLTADVACSNFASINEFEVLEQLLEKKLEKLKAPAEPNDMAVPVELADELEEKKLRLDISKEELEMSKEAVAQARHEIDETEMKIAESKKRGPAEIQTVRPVDNNVLEQLHAARLAMAVGDPEQGAEEDVVADDLELQVLQDVTSCLLFGEDEPPVAVEAVAVGHRTPVGPSVRRKRIEADVFSKRSL